MDFLWFLIIGAIAGWLAGKITQGRGFGVLPNLVIGVIGAMVGGLLFSLLGLQADRTIGKLVTATVGAIVFLFVLRTLNRKP